MLKLRDVMSRWEAGSMSQLEAAEIVGMSERSFRRWTRRFEEEGEGRIATTLTTYNGSNQILSQDIKYDNGSRAVLTYDLANQQGWALRTQAYDGQGRLDYENFRNDDGSSRNVDHDQANASNIAQDIWDYSAAGAGIRHTLVYDDASSQVFMV